MKFELAIAHRVCPVLAKTAANYTDKLAMVRDSASSMARALAGIRTRLIVILDGCPLEYEQLFDDTFGNIPAIDYSKIATSKIGNLPTFAKQMELLDELRSDAEFLYFSEDDYLYKQSAFSEMMSFLRRPEVDFVSPLDHPDAYLPYGEASIASCVKTGTSCHWRPAGTTCCTFMLKSRDYPLARKRLAHYAKTGADYSMWLGITKFGVFSPARVIGGLVRYIAAKRNGGDPDGKAFISILPLLAWKSVPLSLLFSKKLRLWTPIPSLAIHLCTPSLSPCCDIIKA